MSTDGPYLVRMTRVLEERGIAVEPVLSIVSAVGADNVFLGVGTLSDRVQLLVPSHRDALAIVAPSATLPERSMLLVAVRAGEAVTAAAVLGGATTSQQAVDEVGPEPARAAWLPVIDSLVGLSGGVIRNRTRYLGDERGTITVMYPPRSGASEALFGAEVGSVAERIGAPPIWRKVYEEAGRGADVGVTTECTRTGPLPRIALRFGTATWDRAIDLAKALVDANSARDAAVRMGMLAGGLEVDTLRGVETVVDATAPDVVVWLKLR